MAKLAVTKRALVQRINRVLAAKDQRLIGERGRYAGRSYWIVGPRGVVQADVDVEGLARALDVVRSWEKVE